MCATVLTCPCGSQRLFDACCGRFLQSGEKPRTPEQLMRSRYCAHALGCYGEYLVNTWLTAVELGYTAADFSEQKVQWQKLEVLHASQKGNFGTVEFKAYYAGSGKDINVHHERSLFKRVDGVWYYVEAM